MASAENIAFFEKHKKTLEQIIGRENGNRIKAGLEPFTEPELDDLITNLMTFEASGQPITSYKFEAHKTVAPTYGSGQKKFNCEIIECSNGYLMTLSAGAKEQYIFKNIEELTDIFEGVFFKKQKPALELVKKPKKINEGKE